MQIQFTVQEMVGQTLSHLAKLPEGPLLHKRVLAPFRRLQADAADAGFCLTIASGFRDFKRQLSIWNGKASGERLVVDESGQPLDIGTLSSDWERVQAILRWSALPGCSRHHWGTDMDVFDANALPEGYRLQLTVKESTTMFASLHSWLDHRIATNDSYGFFRPYATDKGGVAPEPWHLSYEPLAQICAAQLTPEVLRALLRDTDLILKAAVLEHWEEIYERYIHVD